MTLPPDVLELATTLRETFGPLRISGRLVGKPDPEWTRWPSHTAADMAPSAWRAPGRREAQARCSDLLSAASITPAAILVMTPAGKNCARRPLGREIGDSNFSNSDNALGAKSARIWRKR